MQIKKKALSLLLSVMLGVTMLVALPAQAYAVAPTISSATLQQGQNRVRVEFSEGIWGDAAQTTPVLDTDFVLSYSGSATVTLDHISKESNAALTGGESFILFYFTVSGTVSAGDTIEITTAPGASIFNGAGEAVTTTETTGVLTFLQPITWLTATANGSSGVTTTTTLTLTFSEDPGALTTGVVSITGATLDSISGSGTTRVLSISNITVADGAALNVYIPSTFGGGAITPTNRYPAVYVAAPVYVCEIVGGAQYTSLLSALTAANSGDTIKFLTSISEYTNLEIYDPDELTIDLNGFDWDLEGGYIYVGGGTLTVTGGGNVTAWYIEVISGGTLYFYADYTGEDGLYADGEGSTVTVVGNIVVDDRAVNALYGGVITVTGDISLYNTGNTEHYAVLAVFGGDVTINGNIKASGSELATGVYCEFDSRVTVNGTIDAPRYISLGSYENDSGVFELILAADDHDGVSSRPGYLQYSRTYDNDGVPGSDYVWVRIGGTNPNPDPGPTIPKTGDFDTLLASSLSLLFALMGAGVLVVSRRKVRQS